MAERLDKLGNPVRDAYFSLFVLFYKISRWKNEMRATSAVYGVSLVIMMFFFALLMWWHVVFNYPLDENPFVLAALFFPLFFTNRHLLVTRRGGVAFERAFNEFPKAKRIQLLGMASVILILIFSIFLYSIDTYRSVFHTAG